MSNKIILFENQLVMKNIKNKFGDTIKKYLHLQNIKLKKLSVKQIINITIWRKATIKGCVNIAVEMTGDRKSYVGVKDVS
jgi:hypothetical protein